MNIQNEIKEFSSFIEEFIEESDRAAVILGVAKLDLLLYQIFQKHLVSNPGGEDKFLDSDGPLVTFSAKINLAYRLGLTDNSVTRALHLIRKIRNDFAHEVEGCSLESGSHRDRIRELIAPIKNLNNFDKLCVKYIKEGKLSLPSIQFRVMLGLIVIDLDLFYENCDILTGKYALTLLYAAKEINSSLSNKEKNS